MADILQDFPIRAEPARVFAAISTPRGLDEWWTLTSSGEAREGATYDLGFGPSYQWRAVVTACEPGTRFELRLTDADPDWTGSVVGFALEPFEGGTLLRFSHRGWPAPNEHYRTSSHCWALYLRVLRRHLEHGERVPYEKRLDA